MFLIHVFGSIWHDYWDADTGEWWITPRLSPRAGVCSLGQMLAGVDCLDIGSVWKDPPERPAALQWKMVPGDVGTLLWNHDDAFPTVSFCGRGTSLQTSAYPKLATKNTEISINEIK